MMLATGAQVVLQWVANRPRVGKSSPSHLPSESITMRQAIAILLLLLSSVLTCTAAQPTSESIETLLTLTKTEALVESVYGNVEQAMRQGMAQAVAEKKLSAEQQRYLEATPKRFVTIMREELSWESLKPMYIEIYRDSFTQEEIDGLIAFYQSPVGMAFVNKMPIVMQKSMTSMQARMQPMMEKMKAAMRQALEDAKVAK